MGQILDIPFGQHLRPELDNASLVILVGLPYLVIGTRYSSMWLSVAFFYKFTVRPASGNAHNRCICHDQVTTPSLERRRCIALAQDIFKQAGMESSGCRCLSEEKRYCSYIARERQQLRKTDGKQELVAYSLFVHIEKWISKIQSAISLDRVEWGRTICM